MKLSLSSPVAKLYMIGPTMAQRLKKLEIFTIEDLLSHYPFRYDDYSLISPIAQVQVGETITIQGKVISCQNIYTQRGKKMQKVLVLDSTGQIEAIWFNQPFLSQTFKPEILVSLAGKIDWFNRKPSLISPEYEVISSRDSTLHTGRLVPVYPETYGVSSKWLRSRIAPLVKMFVPGLSDWLPQTIKQENKLIDLASALAKIHFPKNTGEIYEARERLKFDELFLIQLRTLLRQKQWQKNKTTRPFKITQEKINLFLKQLPFKLTNAQDRAVREIMSDLKSNKPMNRLLEGDVGSGKTVVAALAIYTAYLNGLQSAFMAPTEILAFQHYQTLKQLLTPLGLNICLLTGSSKFVSNAKTDLFIGTHALIYNKVKMDNLGLVVIDEQHRFGVEQRTKLIKKGSSPHFLTMTATPIPRTVALTLYGDLDLSVLDELPPGRIIVKTWVVPPEKRTSAYNWIKKQIKEESAQVFIVCPLIEESQKESMKEIRAAKDEFKRLSQLIFPSFKLGLLHGRLKAKEKEKIISDFRQKKLAILVATPVVEVGLDIPQATIMLVEGAERFGLAQLHQLRGRVGRSAKKSYCLLFTSIKEKLSLKRLTAMQTYHSGFKLAEIDLKLRGPGEIYGTKQHGFSQLKIASFADVKLIENTRLAGQKLVNTLSDFPLLKEKLKKYTIRAIEPN